MRTVGELSRLAGVTIRTLHHYDRIGLLCPSGRSEAGYRLYAYEDLTRLQEIVVWRQLGFSLQEIQQLLDEPGHDRAEALRRQRELVELQHQESARRAAGYGEREWAEIRAEADRVVKDFTALMQAGQPVTGQPACAVAERHRRHISRWFYPVSTEMHRNLAAMYVADPRFRATYEKVADGLAAYVHDAVVANADAQDAVSR
jgi:DNA-binding transcriptional MerR regulator